MSIKELPEIKKNLICTKESTVTFRYVADVSNRHN